MTLGYLDCARVLLQHGADVSKENRNGWTGECDRMHSVYNQILELILDQLLLTQECQTHFGSEAQMSSQLDLLNQNIITYEKQ